MALALRAHTWAGTSHSPYAETAESSDKRILAYHRHNSKRILS